MLRVQRAEEPVSDLRSRQCQKRMSRMDLSPVLRCRFVVRNPAHDGCNGSGTYRGNRDTCARYLRSTSKREGICCPVFAARCLHWVLPLAFTASNDAHTDVISTENQASRVYSLTPASRHSQHKDGPKTRVRRCAGAHRDMVENASRICHPPRRARAPNDRPLAPSRLRTLHWLQRCQTAHQVCGPDCHRIQRTCLHGLAKPPTTAYFELD
jgi:hypothetical protein